MASAVLLLEELAPESVEKIVVALKEAGLEPQPIAAQPIFGLWTFNDDTLHPTIHRTCQLSKEVEKSRL